MRFLFYPSVPKSFLCDQFAFRPTASTNAALVQLFHNVINILETNEHARCFLIDFSKAFDSVSHSKLLDKLAVFGCLQVVTIWLANFLTDRTQSVISLSGKSGNLAITRSIIQGSGTGPTAFLVMIIDLHRVKTTKFADNLTIVIPGSLVLNGVVELSSILEWAKQNKLIINMSKSKENVLCKSRE